MANNLRSAIDGFPVVRWLEQKTKVWDPGGPNVWISCPVCGGRKKLGVHRHQKKIHCFKCDEGGEGGNVWDGKGNLLRLIQLVEHCSKREAVEILFRMSGTPDYGYQVRELPPSKIPQEAIPLRDARSHPAAIELIRRHCGHLVDSSYVCVDGRYSHRYLMPVHWFGALLGFDAKAYHKKVFPKSLYPEWQLPGAMHATGAWDHSSDFAVITESVLDAETLGVNAIGLLGSVLRDAQLTRLLELRQQGVERLVWFLDDDAWSKQCNAIIRKTSRFRNYVVDIPPGADPNQLGRDACWALVRSATLVKDSLELFSKDFSRTA